MFSNTLLPKNKNRGKLAPQKIKKYQKLRQNGEMVKKAGKRALPELQKAKYIQADDEKTMTMTLIMMS